MLYSTDATVRVRVRQEPSHEALIKQMELSGQPSTAPAKLDAIVVPAGRPARNLMTAAGLARDIGCHLVVLCSLRTDPDAVRRLFNAQGLTPAQGTAVRVPPGYSLPGLSLETTEWAKGDLGQSVCGGRNSDLSVKRNIGLLVARMLGWKNIFFMDDDIRGIYVYDLMRTVSLLGGDRYHAAGLHVERLAHSESVEERFQATSTRLEYSRATGTQEEHFQLSRIEVEHFLSSSMQVKHFPDNSVVCHARRMVGEDQAVFVTGSVLGVDCTAPFDFFPDIYNEDWFFFYRDVAARKLASPGLHATQKMAQIKYNPFADPQRARREEFGDVIAEGLYSLLHRRNFGPHSPTKAYWELFLRDRRAILERVTEQIDNAPPERRAEIEKAILASQEILEMIEADMCVDYVACWQQDLRRWWTFRDNLRPKRSVEDALRSLGLGL